MRKLAAFAAAFSAGVFAAQYLLPREWQLPECAILLLLSLKKCAKSVAGE